MFHSISAFWKQLELVKLYENHPKLKKKPLPKTLEGCPIRKGEVPTDRVLRLLARSFADWKQKPRWLSESDTPHLLAEVDEKRRRELSRKPVAIRKALAIARVLDIVTSPEVAQRAGTFRIHPDELVVGCIPPYSVAQGKELVGYLTEQEELEAALNLLNDRAPFGHITPDYETLLRKGIRGIIRDCRRRLKALGRGRTEEKLRQRTFYQAGIIALEGVATFAQRYAQRAIEMAQEYQSHDRSRHENLKSIAERLTRTPIGPPKSFLDAVQCLYLFHCALHTTGEITSIGRLDQLLMPFLEKDSLKESEVQEIIDCLWIKFGERAIHNRSHLEDRFTFCDGALLGNKMPANYDQGSLTNQWMQQVTISGYKANNSLKGEDGTNRVTYLCLNSSRRLPLNSPTLDLRVHRRTPKRLLREASRTILSGGAHPIILNDDRIVPVLHKQSGGRVSRKSARNYACDGCYETHFAGETEFSFFYIPALDLLEKTLNRGAGFAGAGPIHLRGWKDSFRTSPATEFESFEQLLHVFTEHLDLQVHRMFRSVYHFYGEKELVAPSPLLSTLISGCISSGRDLSGGGANYKMLSPLMTGISTCADSLYAIKHLVFDRKQVLMSEMLACLYSNWGEVEPAVGLSVSKARIQQIRKQVMRMPKFGHGRKAVDDIAWRLIDLFCDRLFAVRSEAPHQHALERLKERYGSKFEMLIVPGVGTFEQYVFAGGFAGATPDGRKSRQPIESDISPAPYYQDLSMEATGRKRHPREIPIRAGLSSYLHPSLDRLSDGAPVDVNLSEDFTENSLIEILSSIAKGKLGSNIVTFTVADPATFQIAQTAIGHDFDLVRVRMGGWTEYYRVLSAEHQKQHARRPLFVED